ncbi:MAG: type II toxin-antitoxin system VapC family toxin [Bryobacteraceae bacterium]
MKGLDTNVLVRYLTQDDPRQAAQANRVIGQAAESGVRLVIQPVVICELIWVLEDCYGFRKGDINTVIERILRTAQFEVVDKETVWQAFGDWTGGRGDFADYYIGRANARAGAASTVTFARALRGGRGFEVLSAS